MRSRAIVLTFLTCAISHGVAGGQADSARDLGGWFSEANASSWRRIHCELEYQGPGALRATFWKGYENTGFERTQIPEPDWSKWKSLQFNVDNPYLEPFSIYVRISSRADHPVEETYTGGTFDGFVIVPGRNLVEISLEKMRSPEESPVDPHRIAYVGIFFQPLFLRDGMDLKFAQDKSFRISDPRLSASQAKSQKQPYGDLLFRETESSLVTLREEVEQALSDLRETIDQAKGRGVETAYAEIYPFVAQIAFQTRLVAVWQDRVQEQDRVLRFLLQAAKQADQELRQVLEGKSPARPVPPMPDYGNLVIRDRYFRHSAAPVLLFGMLYNRKGPLMRWFTNSETDYGTQLVAGGTRHDVERQPIWQAYQTYPDTHRVGWANADHIIRDRNSWEVLGPPVNVCLESPHSREAVAKMIETFERAHAGESDHLVQNLGYEYTYVCYCDFSRRMWQEWLARKYGSMARANHAWGTHFNGFDEAPMPRPENAASNLALWFDWSSFNLYRFMEQIRWTRDQIRRWEPAKPLTVGSPYFAFSPAFWTGVDEEELADSGITGVVLEENYILDTLMPEYLHALAGTKPVMDFEYHGEIREILPSFLHGDSAISMWWWNDRKRWTPNEPINEWASSFPQSYTIPLRDIAKAMRDALDIRRLSREIAALGSAPRPVALLYSKTSMLQHPPEVSNDTDSFPYLSELRRIYRASQAVGIYVGITTEKKIEAGDLEQRKILVLPAAEFVPDHVASAVLRWVEGGGTLVVSPDSLLADEYAKPARTLGRLGLRLIRREPPRLTRSERFVTEYNFADLPRLPLAQVDGRPYTAAGRALHAAGGRQVLECNAAAVTARFPDGSPALVRLPRGKGVIYWLAAPLDSGSWGHFLAHIAENAGLKPGLRVTQEGGAATPEVELRATAFEGRRLAYLYNNSDQDLRLDLHPDFEFEKCIDRRAEVPLSLRGLLLPAGETAILEFIP